MSRLRSYTNTTRARHTAGADNRDDQFPIDRNRFSARLQRLFPAPNVGEANAHIVQRRRQIGQEGVAVFRQHELV